MSQVGIENPVINAPFDEPTRHFRFGDEGITDDIVEGRRSVPTSCPSHDPEKRRAARLRDRVDRGMHPGKPTPLRHRLLVHRHRLRRRELFCAAHLFHRAEEPCDKLKRALRAEVDEAAWAALYRTVSRPFTRPASGKVAVMAINHYGDEVLKVFAV